MIRILPILFVIICISCTGQKPIDDYVGGWSGSLTERNPFEFDVEVSLDKANGDFVKFIGRDGTTTIGLEKDMSGYLQGRYDDQLVITIDTSDSEPVAFIHTGHHLSHLKLEKKGAGRWLGSWNLLMSGEFTPTMYLSLDKYEDGNYGASTFFKEPTFHYMWGDGFVCEQGNIAFTDIRSNLKFKGQLKQDKIILVLHFLKEETIIELSPLHYDEWEMGEFNEENDYSGPSNMTVPTFGKLYEDIRNGTLERTHSVVISQHKKTIYEHYFDGFNSEIPHDTRSLSKSFASSVTGIAIARNLLESESVRIRPFFDSIYPEIDWCCGKDSITIYHLLTMSSGLDAIDFGINRTSFANEGAYQRQDDWTKHILSAPMVNEVGSSANYGSGNPHLLAPILASRLNERLAFFIHKNLFQPLDIENYRIQTNNKEQPYFGGGWYFTPRDLIKFGQLYLQKGEWGDRQIIPEEWVEKSLGNYFILENTVDKNPYGYLFWHKTYTIGDESIASFEARGAGGQYLFMVPDYDLVAVITSGNYRNNKGFQPEKIMKDYILTEIVR